MVRQMFHVKLFEPRNKLILMYLCHYAGFHKWHIVRWIELCCISAVGMLTSRLALGLFSRYSWWSTEKPRPARQRRPWQPPCRWRTVARPKRPTPRRPRTNREWIMIVFPMSCSMNCVRTLAWERAQSLTLWSFSWNKMWTHNITWPQRPWDPQAFPHQLTNLIPIVL